MAVAALDQLRSLFSGTTGSIVTPINKNNNNNNKNEFADRYQAAVTPPGRTLAGPLQLEQALSSPSAPPATIQTYGSVLKSKELLADQKAQPRSGNTRNKIYTWLEEQGLSAIGSREPQVETRWISFGDDGSLISANSKGSSDLHCALESSGSDFATNQTTAAVHQAMEEDPKIALFANFNNGFVAVVMFYGTTQPSHRRPLSRFTTSEAWVGFAYEWPKDGSDDAAAQKAVDTISKTVQSLAKTKGTLLDFKYMTFDTGSQKVLGSYGAENIKLMQEVAAKYDPEGVFQKLQNGGFLLRDNI
ncbi:hypothetical protein AnigIFM56816_011636 [Aspergillus niger]|nr:hypothetical protein AnigIFM56816_011636 [Aspergillus niger]